MHELTPDNTTEYLRKVGRVAPGDRVSVRELSGGVSNVVLRVDVDGREPMVVKQCRERLRVAVEWLARLDRIWVEHATLGVLADILPDGTVPKVLFDDRPEYLFAMTCAPEDSTTWKSLLMDGQADAGIASNLGTLLGTIHAEAPRHPALATTLADTSLFDELRVDPYYRTTARAHPALAPRIDALIAAMNLPEGRRTLVLGDFSPKNILVHGGGLILLDFECAHAGDPAFDLGFFLSHLALKRIHKSLQDPGDEPKYRALLDAFWTAYLDRVDDRLGPRDELTRRAVEHTAACLLARVDGKSPVEYLDARGREVARESAITLFDARPETWERMLATLDAALPSPY
ncbi:Methylthioribose kinase [Paludisphaera borealis]|uniref:Methylthioribose kinase n=1 Tax=Paludisphaera borealis TaxID=1387353 RepID=A0A1U7CX19_9BACT|nr:Methylthioribose kinase [Paludisphaera borealis]